MQKTIIILFTLSIQFCVAQKTWSFQDCVDYAIENNINVNQNKLSIDYAQNAHLQNKMDLYTPNANATVTEGFNFANSINPLTYQFIQQNTNSTSFGLFFDYDIFQGLSRLHQLKSTKNELNATQLEQKELENNTKLMVANYYLNVLLANESYQIAKDKRALTLNQVNRTKELVNAGVLAVGDKYEAEALLATDELNIVTAENSLEMALNQLKLLLQLDPFEEFGIEGIDVVEDQIVAYDNQVKLLSANAMNKLPNIDAVKYRSEAAKYQLKAAKSSLSPTISISSYIGSNYFSAAQQQVGTEPINNQPIGFVNGTGELVLTSYNAPIYGNKNFGAQVSDNFNQNLRLNLNIPIFGKWQRMIAIDNAKLNILKTEYDLKNKENALQQDVFNAYTQLKAAFKNYEANQSNYSASALAFTYAEEKFKAGVLNAYEFETAKIRFVNAKVSSIQSKYEYLFRKLIVQFYETGELKL